MTEAPVTNGRVGAALWGFALGFVTGVSAAIAALIYVVF